MIYYNVPSNCNFNGNNSEKSGNHRNSVEKNEMNYSLCKKTQHQIGNYEHYTVSAVQYWSGSSNKVLTC